ncbi:MAG: hypothetical protein AB8B93_01315 [Pseudomonadales bacterium]
MRTWPCCDLGRSWQQSVCWRVVSGASNFIAASLALRGVRGWQRAAL